MIKTIKDSVLDVDAQKRVLKAYVSKFGNIDSDRDMIHAGSYKKTITETGPEGKNRIKHLWNHDWTKILSKPRELYEDEVGVVMVSEIVPTSYGKDVILLYENGDIDEHSVGIMPIKEYDEKGVNHITEVKMLEASTVTWGANEDARTIDFKNENVLETLARYENLLKSYRNGNFADETFLMIEEVLKRHKELLKTALEAASHSEPPEEEIIDKLIKHLRQ